MSFFKHSREFSGTADSAAQHRDNTPGGAASTGDVVATSTTARPVPRHTGYAPTDLGMTCSAAKTAQLSGYAPTDTSGPHAERSPVGGPAGMAGGALFHSQGGALRSNRLGHSGWGPADASFNGRRPLVATSAAHHDDVPPSDTVEFVGR